MNLVPSEAQLTKRQSNLLSKPWITKGLLTSMRIGDSLFRDFLNSSTADIKSFLREKYKFYRNRIVSLIRASKTIHYSRGISLNTQVTLEKYGTV